MNKSHLICSRYQLKCSVGNGAFGKIFKAFDTTNKEWVAIKIVISTSNNNHSTLAKEAKVLDDLSDCVGFPRLVNFKTENEREILVMSCEGPNLEDLFQMLKRPLRIESICRLADQMFERIEALHNKGWLHRDIKPENFIIGRSQNSCETIHLIDFGLAKQYKDPLTGKHIPYKETRKYVGTQRYMSLNAHFGAEQCRKDDLESLLFVLIYFAKGRLPWQNVQAETAQEKYRKTAEIKNSTSVDVLCKHLPPIFANCLRYVRELTFEQAPNYKWIRCQFQSHLENLLRTRSDSLYTFDWMECEAYRDLLGFRSRSRNKLRSLLTKRDSFDLCEKAIDECCDEKILPYSFKQPKALELMTKSHPAMGHRAKSNIAGLFSHRQNKVSNNADDRNDSQSRSFIDPLSVSLNQWDTKSKDLLTLPTYILQRTTSQNLGDEKKLDLISEKEL